MDQEILRKNIVALDAYTPGLSIDEIRQKYNCASIIKMASNENPLGVPPLAAEAIRRHAEEAFRYPRGGNPRLVKALARHHDVPENTIICGNGSDEIIDLLIRMLCEPREHAIVCFNPCFSLYPIQARISDIAVESTPLRDDFSFDFDALLGKVDARSRLVFLTTPDNPSGYCPPLSDVRAFAETLLERFPRCLLVIDEAYVDFCEHEEEHSLLRAKAMLPNTVCMRTFSKSFGLAGLRLGYAVVPEILADAYWRARLPFSVNLLAEEAGLAALADHAFRDETLRVVKEGRKTISENLTRMGCTVMPSEANFLLFSLPSGHDVNECFTTLLSKGIIIRTLKGYNLPNHLRVSVGNEAENKAFLAAMDDYLR
ncbi:MAG: histidinol-phosphate transaminase [Desulfovibrio sp.]|nr:histidinol-phosphate transaminase [Desulfovibrio sp.]